MMTSEAPSSPPPEPGPSQADAMTVAEVRKALSLMRRRWDCIVDHAKDTPMLTEDLDLGSKQLAAENFALRFILGQHARKPAAAVQGPAPQAVG